MAKVAPQHLVVVLGHDRDTIAPAVAELSRELGRTIAVAVQEEQLGTGHATGCGLDALPAGFDGVVVVTSGDIPLLDADTLADLVATHRAEPAAVTVLTTTLPDPTGYGRILRTQDREVIGIVEQADASASQRQIREVNAGVYAFDLAALRSALSRLREDNAQHERYLTDVVSIVRQDGLSVHAKHVDDTMLVAGINDRVQLAALAAELNARIVAAHQRAGVTIMDPATTWVDVDVTIGRDTVVRPGTQLLGSTRIGGQVHDRTGHHAGRRDRRRRRIGGAHARRLGVDRRRRGCRSLRLPAAGHRARRRRQARRVRRDQERDHRRAAPRCRT